jgi:hypothetical protein
MTQAAYDAGCFPNESWINPAASETLSALGGFRPFWGWNGRLNGERLSRLHAHRIRMLTPRPVTGPADNFISSCVSCHSTAGRTPDGAPTMRMTPPNLARVPDAPARWAAVANHKVPEAHRADPEGYAMRWFENGERRRRRGRRAAC